jgi:hypothetical protein
MQNLANSQQLQRARRLVDLYCALTESIAAMLTFGAPDTLLPATKDKIRQAFRDVIGEESKDASSASRLAGLRSAYISLAAFLPYDEANAAARLKAAFDRHDHGYIASPAAAQAMACVQKIEQEAGTMAKEFDALLDVNDEEATNLLSEIDSILAEYTARPHPATNY